MASVISSPKLVKLPLRAPTADQCTRCRESWEGTRLDHMIEYRCSKCGYSARETSGGLSSYTRTCDALSRYNDNWRA